MQQKLSYSNFKQISYATTLPGSPADGDLHVLVDSESAPTWSWMFRYVAAKASNKWVFIGGPPAVAETGMGTTFEGTASTSYAALATAGPSLAVPVAGDYIVTIGADIRNDTNADPWMSYDIGGTGAVDADGALSTWGNAGNGAAIVKIRRKNGLTAVTLTAKYKAGDVGATANFRNRFMTLMPVAIGG